MNQKVVLLLFLSLAVFSCSESKKADPKNKVIEKYFYALNHNQTDSLTKLFHDSVRIGEGEFWSVYSKNDYNNWLKWDAIFKPNYEILKVDSKDKGLELTISKQCTRTLFLNESPVISKELFRFTDNKIHSVEITEYVVFNDTLWNSKKEKLIKCIQENQPSLNGFIYDQTEIGARNYLQAIDVFKDKCSAD